jgi:tRNA(Ile2) C34 agmatinyltransferase TiaS
VFTAVRCPECGYEGRAPEFRSGCPVCGYRTRSKEQYVTEPASRAARKPGLPPAFYRVAVVVLGALILGLVALLILQA